VTSPIDWRAAAWENLPNIRQRHPELRTLEQALAHRIIGRVICAHAAQLMRQHMPRWLQPTRQLAIVE
jgi:hypothetical protein